MTMVSFTTLVSSLKDIHYWSGGIWAVFAFEAGTTVFIFNVGPDIQDGSPVYHVQSLYMNDVATDLEHSQNRHADRVGTSWRTEAEGTQFFFPVRRRLFEET